VPAADTLTASDNCDTSVIVLFNEQIIDGSCPSDYTLIRTWTVEDCARNTNSHIQTINVQDTSAPIVVRPASDQTVMCDGSGNSNELQTWLDTNAGANAVDVCGTVTWTNDFTGLINECGSTGFALVSFTATDECGNATNTTALFTILDLTPPVLQGKPTNEVIECGPNSDVTLQNWLDSNGGATATDSCGDVTWTNDFNGLSDECGSTGFAIVTFTATDACGNSISASGSFSIEDTTDPIFNEVLPIDETVECDSADITNPAILTASDNCGTADVIFSETTADGSCPSAYVLTRTWTATDECGNITTHTQTITVEDNTAPTFNETLPTDETAECDSADLTNPAVLTASDNCGTADVTFSESTADGSCPNSYILTRIWTATDECGNTTSHTQTITV
jgi:hypothetical protein